MARKNRIKSIAQIMSQAGNCKVPGCGREITAFTGSGSDSLCELHQRGLAVNGGFGRLNKPYSFHRTSVCDRCCTDYAQHPVILAIADDETRNRALRTCMIGDHKVRRVDGGADTAENIQTLCRICDAIKTTLEQDYLAGVRPAS